MTNEERVREYLSQQCRIAQARYDHNLDETLFDWAVMGRNGTIKRQNLLVNDAMAICGSPYHTMSRNHWSETAWQFLALFTGGCKMTRKDYRLVAEVLAKENVELSVVLAFCERLEEDNPLFSPVKFIAYINKIRKGG